MKTQNKKPKLSKTDRVLKHLQEKGSITSWEAIKEFGATRLSAIIFNLRHGRKLNIKTIPFEFEDRFGYKSSYAKYVYTAKKTKK